MKLFHSAVHSLQMFFIRSDSDPFGNYTQGALHTLHIWLYSTCCCNLLYVHIIFLSLPCNWPTNTLL